MKRFRRWLGERLIRLGLFIARDVPRGAIQTATGGDLAMLGAALDVGRETDDEFRTRLRDALRESGRW